MLACATPAGGQSGLDSRLRTLFCWRSMLCRGCRSQRNQAALLAPAGRRRARHIRCRYVIHLCMHVHLCMHIHYTSTYIYVCASMYIHLCNIHVHLHVYTCIHMYTHLHIHSLTVGARSANPSPETSTDRASAGMLTACGAGSVWRAVLCCNFGYPTAG